MVKIFKEIKVAMESINQDLDIIFVKKKKEGRYYLKRPHSDYKNQK